MCVLYGFSCSGWDFWLEFIKVDVRLNVGFQLGYGGGGVVPCRCWVGTFPSLKLMTMGS